MPIPGPGTAISMNTIAGEFGGTVPHSLSEYYRGAGLVPNTPVNAAIATSGAISMGSFYGAANRVSIPLVISSPAVNYDVYNNRGPSYVPGSSDITLTVNPGVVVGSPSTGSYAMLVPSSFSPGDTVTIINNGAIYGAGGPGGAGGQGSTVPRLSIPTPQFYANPGVAGSAGGHAVYVNRPVTITNNGTIAGGGGGGGGGGGYAQYTTPSGAPSKSAFPYSSVGGGGGGGGAGSSGGSGGAGGPAVIGAVPFYAPGGFFYGPGQAGGGGTTSVGGTGGLNGFITVSPVPSIPTSGRGGAGGGLGATGTAGNISVAGGPAGPQAFALAPGGAGGSPAGRYITGNPFVTWPVTGNRIGGVS